MSALPHEDAWRRVALARHPARACALDYIRRLTSDLHELHGDRLSGDDPALVAGVASWHSRPALFLGQQRGSTHRERVTRNFGMMHPEGYRRAIRLARLAARLGLPIVSLVDTPGAYPGTGAEERGIAGAIATTIMDWFRIRTPIVAAVIGEGGSGGALGLAIADRVLILENAIYSVAAPEVCASIVWRDASHRMDAAAQLRLTARDLLCMGVVDEIVCEPGEGVHEDHDRAAELLDEALHRHVLELQAQDADVLLRRRRQRFRDNCRTTGPSHLLPARV